MTDQHALELIRRGDSAGLRQLIERYSAYVSTIVWNILRGSMSVQDAEEITADVFCTLWLRREKPTPRKLRPYLGAMARNAARRALNERGFELSLEEDVLSVAADGPENALEAHEQAELIRRAVHSLPPPDDEIFLRHYYYGQSTQCIADALGLTGANVRQRLHRGREKLRTLLQHGGITHAQ